MSHQSQNRDLFFQHLNSWTLLVKTADIKYNIQILVALFAANKKYRILGAA
jgi:hypothetical protein